MVSDSESNAIWLAAVSYYHPHPCRIWFGHPVQVWSATTEIDIHFVPIYNI